MDPNPGSLEGVELGHLPRIGLGQEGVGTNQPFQNGGQDSHHALALGDLLLGRLHLVGRSEGRDAAFNKQNGFRWMGSMEMCSYVLTLAQVGTGTN